MPTPTRTPPAAACKNYSEGFKGEVVKAALDEQLTTGRAAKDFEVSRETVRNWVIKKKRRRAGKYGYGQASVRGREGCGRFPASGLDGV